MAHLPPSSAEDLFFRISQMQKQIERAQAQSLAATRTILQLYKDTSAGDKNWSEVGDLFKHSEEAAALMMRTVNDLFQEKIALCSILFSRERPFPLPLDPVKILTFVLEDFRIHESYFQESLNLFCEYQWILTAVDEAKKLASELASEQKNLSEQKL